MATSTVDPAAAPSSTGDGGDKAPLRRATYVNVDKLVRAQYEIDLQLLHGELEKLKAAKAEQENTNPSGEGGGDVTKKGGEGAGTSKPNAWSGTNLTVLPRAPLPGKYHQSRLQPPRDGFNLCLQVGKVELVVDKYRVDGSRVLVAEVEVGDETGSISLRARDEQIDLLRQVSESRGAIVLRNCTMELYQGKHLRLAVSKWGKMSAYPDGIESTPNPPCSMNKELNFSLVDLNVVAKTKLPDEPEFPMPVAMVHHKPHKQQHHHMPKHLVDSPSRGGHRNRRGGPQGGGGGGHHFTHQKKKKDDWQYHHQQHQHQHHHQQQHRPRSGSHLSTQSGQYVQQGGGTGSQSPPQNFAVPQMQYQQYGDAGSVYSYPSQPQDTAQASPHRKPQQQQAQQFLPPDHHYRQQQIMYQQYELQQRHAHQMALLQQQHESQMALLQQQDPQRRMLRQQQQQSALIPDVRRVPSQESGGGGEYSLQPPSLQLGGPRPFPPVSPSQQPMGAPPPPPPLQHPGMSPEYQYGASLVPPFQGNATQQPLGGMGVSNMPPYTTTIISPPMSPAQSSHPAPQAPPQYPGGRLDGSENQE